MCGLVWLGGEETRTTCHVAGEDIKMAASQKMECETLGGNEANAPNSAQTTIYLKLQSMRAAILHASTFAAKYTKLEKATGAFSVQIRNTRVVASELLGRTLFIVRFVEKKATRSCRQPCYRSVGYSAQ